MQTPNDQLLKGLNILDFSHRLPGPFAGYILAKQGANVTKIEDTHFQDPFIKGLFAQMGCGFEQWYKELNGAKKLVRIDFKSPSAIAGLDPLLEKADALIMGLPPRLEAQLNLTPSQLKEKNLALAYNRAEASKQGQKSLHDINALALSGILSLYVQKEEAPIVAPPPLPQAGMAFGQKLASDILATILKVRSTGQLVESTTYLLETTQEIFTPFWPPSMRHKKMNSLQGGSFPCYNLYKTADGHYVALASVEEKFWHTFCQLFKLELAAEDRFSTDQSIFKRVSDAIQERPLQDIISLTQNDDLCLEPIIKGPSCEH